MTLDPKSSSSLDNGNAAQATLNMVAARLFERVLNSNDEELIEMAIGCLATCKEAGVAIKVNIPGDDKTDGGEEIQND